MKYIYNIIFILSLCAFSFTKVQANTLHTIKKLEVALVTTNYQTDSLQIKNEQQKLIAVFTQKQEAFEMRVYMLVGIALFLILLFGVLCFLNKRGDKRLQTILSLLENSKVKEEKTPKDDCILLDIDEAVVTAILENLKAFEEERGFLTSKITLHQFAKQLQTNTKYLSKVINTYKLKSFRNYINDLRIEHSIDTLEKNLSFRKYTVSAIAKEVGFSTRESFSKAFRKKTGETVSSFLSQLNS